VVAARATSKTGTRAATDMAFPRPTAFQSAYAFRPSSFGTSFSSAFIISSQLTSR
jgi:hypothetical protein